MKITLIGSSAFREKKVEIMDQLIEMGHEPVIHPHYVESVKEGATWMTDRMANGENAELKIENDYIKWYHQAINESDAVLLVNLEKNGKKNYVGGNALMELGFAHVADKKIFMWNPFPEQGECPYLDEIEAVQPVVINGNLEKVE